MADFSLDYNSDLTPSPSGDFAVADGDVLTRQRIVRRLCTNPRMVIDNEIFDPDYLYSPLFGAGLGRAVGISVSQSDVNEMTSFIRETLRAEVGVSQATPPNISITIVTGGVRIVIQYQSAYTGAQITLPTLVVS